MKILLLKMMIVLKVFVTEIETENDSIEIAMINEESVYVAE
jgi:hypothetical protein